MDFVVPSNSLDDWVSYAEQVSIVTVLGEEHGPDDTGVSGRGEGHVSGVLSLRIEETLWIAPGVVPRSGNLQVVSLGWTVHDGNWHAINPELKPGVSYLVPLAQFKSGLSPMRPPSIAVVQGRIAASTQAVRSFNGAWSNELDGLVLDQVKTKIEAAHPNERAMQFASLDVEDQVDAVLHGGRR